MDNSLNLARSESCGENWPLNAKEVWLKLEEGEVPGRTVESMRRFLARDRNAVKMWVLTNWSNAAAIALYRATGGRQSPDGDEVSFVYPLDDLD